MSVSRLLDSHAVDATRSTYKKSKQVTSYKCGYCQWKIGHGKSASSRTRLHNVQRTVIHVLTMIVTITSKVSVAVRIRTNTKRRLPPTQTSVVEQCFIYYARSPYLDRHLRTNPQPSIITSMTTSRMLGLDRDRQKPQSSLILTFIYTVLSQDCTELSFTLKGTSI